MRTDYENLDYIHPALRKLIAYIENRYGFEFTETSRHRINDPGVHGQLPVRGEDLRCYDREIGELICEQINAAWIYDPSRKHKKCAMYHDVGEGAHIHLQVHENTRMK